MPLYAHGTKTLTPVFEMLNYFSWNYVLLRSNYGHLPLIFVWGSRCILSFGDVLRIDSWSGLKVNFMFGINWCLYSAIIKNNEVLAFMRRKVTCCYLLTVFPHVLLALWFACAFGSYSFVWDVFRFLVVFSWCLGLFTLYRSPLLFPCIFFRSLWCVSFISWCLHIHCM